MAILEHPRIRLNRQRPDTGHSTQPDAAPQSFRNADLARKVIDDQQDGGARRSSGSVWSAARHNASTARHSVLGLVRKRPARPPPVQP
jgi:hypothetical protein